MIAVLFHSRSWFSFISGNQSRWYKLNR